MEAASFPSCLTEGVHPIIRVYLRSSAANPVLIFRGQSVDALVAG
jgi:hypothetical protein